ncbi:hypothetical protein J3R30DRAFT_3287989, partial [Lentinula aciculospora]
QMLTSNHYLRLKLLPKIPSELSIRQSLHRALLDSFGTTGGSIHLDVLWVSDDGSETVVRVNPRRVSSKNVLAAATSSASPKFQLVKESPFLPSLLSAEPTFCSLR